MKIIISKCYMRHSSLRKCGDNINTLYCPKILLMGQHSCSLSCETFCNSVNETLERCFMRLLVFNFIKGTYSQVFLLGFPISSWLMRPVIILASSFISSWITSVIRFQGITIFSYVSTLTMISTMLYNISVWGVGCFLVVKMR